MSKSTPFGGDDDDDFSSSVGKAGLSKSSTFGSTGSKDLFGDDDKPGARGGSASSSRPSASNPAFKWDDDNKPAAKGSAGKGSSKLFDDDDNDFLSAMNPDSVFGGKKDSKPAPAPSSARGSRPTGAKVDDIFGMFKDDPPPKLPDGPDLDLFGATARCAQGVGRGAWRSIQR